MPVAIAAEVSVQKHEKMRSFIDGLNQKDPSSAISPQGNNNIVIGKIEAYLNRITTFVADFTQIAPNGEASTGTLFMSRPGKVRWQYNPPNPTVIVVNKGLVTYYDYELQQESHAAADSNFVSALLSRKVIKFSGDIAIKNFDHKRGTIKITLCKQNKTDEGTITLVFSEVPIALKKIELTDASDQLTTVTLNNVKGGMPLDNKLFVVRNPKLVKD